MEIRVVQICTRERRTAAAVSFSWLLAALSCMLLRCLACLKAVALGLLLAVLEPEAKTASALRLIVASELLPLDRASGDLLDSKLTAAQLPGLPGREVILGLEHFAGAGGSCKLFAEVMGSFANTSGTAGNGLGSLLSVGCCSSNLLKMASRSCELVQGSFSFNSAGIRARHSTCSLSNART